MASGEKLKKIRVTTVTCPTCQDEIYSRAHYDYRQCLCNETMIDGGFDYLRYGGKDVKKIVTRTRYIQATRRELYEDWNKQVDKFGRIIGRLVNVNA